MPILSMCLCAYGCYGIVLALVNDHSSSIIDCCVYLQWMCTCKSSEAQVVHGICLSCNIAGNLDKRYMDNSCDLVNVAHVCIIFYPMRVCARGYVITVSIRLLVCLSVCHQLFRNLQ